MTRREQLHAKIAAAIDGDLEPPARDALLAELRAFQAEHVAPYGRLVRARGQDAAMPTDVFRYARVAAHEPSDDVRVFRTSGTTSGARGQHFFRDLSLYDRAAKTWAARMLFPGGPMRLVVLAPDETDAPDSSLSYMLSRFATWFGTSNGSNASRDTSTSHASRTANASSTASTSHTTDTSPASHTTAARHTSNTTFCWRDGALDVDALVGALSNAQEPIALLGTSFAFVLAEDALDAANRRFALPVGSRVMQTGGFKGRTREVSPDAMLDMLVARYGASADRVIAEYGMTELSSQAYETTLIEPDAPRRLRFPPWVRVTAVDPVTLSALPAGESGILRIDDAANLDSVCALQTADLARVDADGSFVLFGRAPGATPRGCSLAIEESLDKHEGPA